MDEQGVVAPIVTRTCTRCGGKVLRPDSSCPQCGAPARFVVADRAPATGNPAAAKPGAPHGRVDVPPPPPLSPRQNAFSFASNDAVYPDDEVATPPRRDTARPRVGKGGSAYVWVGVPAHRRIGTLVLDSESRNARRADAIDRRARHGDVERRESARAGYDHAAGSGACPQLRRAAAE